MSESNTPESIPLTEWMESWKTVSDKLLHKITYDYLYYMGYGDILKTYCKEHKVPFNGNKILDIRSNARSLISQGKIDLARECLIEFDVELIDTNFDVNYYLLAQEAIESMQNTSEDKVLTFIGNKLYPITKLNKLEYLKDILEFLVFNTGDNIKKKRNKLASFINNKIIEKYETNENTLKNIVNEIIEGEEKLSNKYKFPSFKNYLEDMCE